jgi:hypothetical protein
VGIIDIKSEIRSFNFKFGSSGADLALPMILSPDTLTPKGRDIKKTINQIIKKTKNKETGLIYTS